MSAGTAGCPCSSCTQGCVAANIFPVVLSALCSAALRGRERQEFARVIFCKAEHSQWPPEVGRCERIRLNFIFTALINFIVSYHARLY